MSRQDLSSVTHLDALVVPGSFDSEHHLLIFDANTDEPAIHYVPEMATEWDCKAFAEGFAAALGAHLDIYEPGDTGADELAARGR